MRWQWVDRITQFASGQSATAVKHVPESAEYLEAHFPGYPVMPASLIIEGMAQTAGILVGESRQYAEKVILAKIRRATLTDHCVPGDEITFCATIESISPGGATTTGVVLKNGTEFGRIDLMFSHVDQAQADLDLPRHNFVFDDQFRQLLNDVYHIQAPSR
jgi:3-hydroxyacyl-[acyl-carrier-protein] dehydratase